MCSGIAEHAEGRRKEKVMIQKAYIDRLMEERLDKVNQNRAEVAMGRRMPLESERYSQIPHRTSAHYDTKVDRERRDQHYQQMNREYSAKLPNRYSSTDYNMQW